MGDYEKKCLDLACWVLCCTRDSPAAIELAKAIEGLVAIYLQLKSEEMSQQ
jgi:hypothetical protein